MTARTAIHWRAAIYAGAAAGILATAAQFVLWWIFDAPLPDILFRDARLTAAIVLGRGVLPPPASFDGAVMAAATLIHFALSITYSLALAWMIRGRPLAPALLAGGLYGLALFGVNMFGFTVIFPWFAQARDGITATAHAVFGVSAAAVYAIYQAAHPSRG